jgi:hypothetical protein
MAFLAAFVSGCSSDDEPDADGPTVTATGEEESSGTPTTEASSTSADPPDAVAAVCAPYSAMVEAIQEAAGKSKDADAIAAEIGPVLKEFAAQVPDLEPPPGLPATTWQGVVALAAQIAQLPDQPTDAEIEAVEGQLSQEERAAVQDAFGWFQTNCA